MKHLKYPGLAIGSALISLAVFVLSYNHFPINIFDEKTFGATITTINGSDTLRDSRAVINTNFANLNNDKMEKTATSSTFLTVLPNLTTIGTIASGTWNGSVINVAYGGTGRATLTANALLLGNGTNGINSLAIGSVGQILMASSTGQAYWSDVTVNESLDYNWTGLHSFAATTTFATTTFSGIVNINQSNVISPTASGSIASKGYVDSRYSASTICASVASLGAQTIYGSFGYYPNDMTAAGSVYGIITATTTVDYFATYVNNNTLNNNPSVTISLSGGAGDTLSTSYSPAETGRKSDTITETRTYYPGDYWYFTFAGSGTGASDNPVACARFKTLSN